jgi:NDP-sugar pyrophosphorylase family protein
MKAMVLAAGLGTRLGPLTNDRPKALVEINGRRLLEITLTRLREFGVREVIINAHHYAEKLADYLRTNNNFGMHIEISYEDVLLDTGGGLKQAAPFFLRDSSPEPFILHNVDVLSTIDLDAMLRFHNHHHALATLAVQGRKSSRCLLFDEKSQLCGRRLAHRGAASDGAGPETMTETVCRCSNPQALAFCGIHLISPRLLTRMAEEGVFSIIDAYLRLAAKGENILAFLADQYYWRDLGTPQQISQAAADLAKGVVPIP